MRLLAGTVEHQLDAKNRIRIPAKFRSAFPDGEKLYYVLYSADRIAVMSESVLNSKLSILDAITPDDEEAMNAMTRIYGSIDEVVEDNQGRSMIPRYFREAANVDKNVVTVGKRDYIEVWAKEVFDATIGGISIREANATAYGKLKADRQ